MLEQLGLYSRMVKLTMEPTLGKENDHTFFSERCHYEDDLIVTPERDNYKTKVLEKGHYVYKLLIEVRMKHGRPDYSSEWRYEPKFRSFYIGFTGVSIEDIVANALEWINERIDTSIEPFLDKNGSYESMIQPLVVHTKRYPHYLDDEK